MTITYELSDIDSVAERIINNAKSKTLLFYGEMGAGKTTLIKSLIKALGSKDSVSSPTFSLVNEYESKEGSIYHFDFYRIEDENEALDMGIEDYLNKDSWKMIEWPQNISKLLDFPTQKLELRIDEQGLRMLKLC
ncbi:tRNA threonylcarbamoyladenosine biosynthesis protein TsaE [Gillisia sp. Hel1_33_143]|uniref:tRNA (adenosine(37)-N6)-threonylcarbamoyltransferase complex ATPase subunit type 1 TsaE n=1 Tax=unclassified Gillisia TaxID=2615025 RepID=UPI000558844F|nr:MULTISPECIES: tRNA (adenosine(37)-N6)-threonylcarbamoyltransferase complex ATPase subunit type 1 TsaE [unclassified Gillisia]SDS62598.1 tRNA threonylcarbamoyladenosine biosynthesis protein TsaE [Gillisia sp. Hel1_33_143]